MGTEDWSDEFLDRMRQTMDPPVDRVVAAVVDSGETDAVDKLMANLILNDGLIPQQLPPPVIDYLQQTAQLPAWADPARIAVAQKLFLAYAPEIVLLLFYASLPTAYADGKGAHVLDLTRRLEQGYIYRRIVETAQFVVDVLTPGSFEPQGEGMRAIQKVRLMHATIRHYILHEDRWQSNWNASWGLPINQEDLGLTLMTFSTVVTDGLRRFNIRVTPGQEEAYLHTWRVIGDMLGLQPELLPATTEDARGMLDAIERRLWESNSAGKDLTTALTTFLDGYMPFWLKGLPNSMLRYFSGDHLADMLGVGPRNLTAIVPWLLSVLFGLTSSMEDSSRGFRRFARWINLQILNELLSANRDGNRPPFRIPERLSPTGLKVRSVRPSVIQPHHPPSVA